MGRDSTFKKKILTLMSFYFSFLPSYEELKEEFDNLGETEFIQTYKKYEFYIGEDKSVEFINNIMKNYNQKKYR